MSAASSRSTETDMAVSALPLRTAVVSYLVCYEIDTDFLLWHDAMSKRGIVTI